MTQRAKQALRLTAGIAAALAAATGLFWAAEENLTLCVTPSVPRGIYRYADGEIRTGDLVSACLPETPLMRAALERGYLLKGSCPGGWAPVIKRAAASEGDVVSIGENGIVVNGRKLPNTEPREVDGRGDPLPLLRSNRTLGPDDLVLASENDPKGFDSRYFGVLSKKGAKRVEPVWTE